MKTELEKKIGRLEDNPRRSKQGTDENEARAKRADEIEEVLREAENHRKRLEAASLEELKQALAQLEEEKLKGIFTEQLAAMGLSEYEDVFYRLAREELCRGHQE